VWMVTLNCNRPRNYSVALRSIGIVGIGIIWISRTRARLVTSGKIYEVASQ
jgi:hypothetical protein